MKAFRLFKLTERAKFLELQDRGCVGNSRNRLLSRDHCIRRDLEINVEPIPSNMLLSNRSSDEATKAWPGGPEKRMLYDGGY